MQIRNTSFISYNLSNGNATQHKSNERIKDNSTSMIKCAERGIYVSKYMYKKRKEINLYFIRRNKNEKNKEKESSKFYIRNKKS